MSETIVHRDERTTSVENASYRWGFLLISFGLLLIVAARSFVYKEAAWDLLALVILAGLFTTVYQAYHAILTPRWVWVAAASAGVAFLVAAVVAYLR